MMSTLAPVQYEQLLIDGRWIDPASGRYMDVVHPGSGERFARAPEGDAKDVDLAVQAARRAFDSGPWPRRPISERLEILRRLRDLYAARVDDFSGLITTEMGCPVSVSKVMQGPGALAIFDYYLSMAETFAFEDVREDLVGASLVIRDPVGVVAAIVPWNAPQSSMVLKTVPAMIAGCTTVVKPSPETPLDALMLGELALEAGIDPGVLNVVPGGAETGEALISHPGVDKVTFTGSTATGRHIAEVCGRDLRRVTLELGGKSAAILLEDADLDIAIEAVKAHSIANSGQICVNHTRLLAPRSRYGEILERLEALFAGLRVGDPFDPATEVGPLASSRQRERVDNLIASFREEGARLVRGGGHPEGLEQGYFVEPTIFADVDNSMRIAQEEIFGPVLAVIPYETEDDAVDLANDSLYGLGGGVWGADDDRALSIARRLRTGQIRVNGNRTGLSAPFGGFKQSGIGRELGPEGLSAYLEVKSIGLDRVHAARLSGPATA